MTKWILIAAAASLAACSQQAEEAAPAEAPEEAMVEEAAADEAMSLNETSWEFTRDGVSYVESIDADGNFIVDTADGEHSDHGTYVAKDGKACFTSAMTDEGEMCWTVENVEVGESFDTTSDKGETITVKRVEYRPLTMPS